jgi:CubicO group peptidase (beta-lactamase class C family)
MMDAGSLHGVVLLQRGSEDLVAVAGGRTGSDPDTDCTLGTRFQIASVSKQFTAAAVLLLADRGVLSVDDPVRDWLDGCPAAWEAVTVHHLLSHSGGLAHWHDLPGLDLTRPVDTGELLSILAGAPLLSPAGERFSYSSPGFVLLARIVEHAAGQSYGTFVAREIFGPLGMAATFSGNPGGEPGLALGHHDGVAVPSWELGTANVGTGGIWSTARDLARWDRALASGEILSDAARQAMFTAHVPARDDDGVIRTEGYGYGWYAGSAAGGRRLFYHPGDNPGYLAFNAWFPDDDVRLVMLSNEEAIPAESLLHDLIRTAFPAALGSVLPF